MRLAPLLLVAFVGFVCSAHAVSVSMSTRGTFDTLRSANYYENAADTVLAEVESTTQAMTGAKWNLGDRVCHCTGDTHCNPWGGASLFDIYNHAGPFIAAKFDQAKNKEQRFRLDCKQRVAGWGSSRPTIQSAVMQCGNDVIKVHNRISWPTRPFVNIWVNGIEITNKVDGTPRAFMPRAPKKKYGNTPAYAIWKSIGSWSVVHVDCDHRGTMKNGANDYAAGFLLTMSWPNHSQRWIYGNMRLYVHDTWYSGRMSGACGFYPNGKQPRHINHVINTNDSLYGLKPSDHAKAAKETGVVADPAKVKEKMAECTAAMKKATNVDPAKLADQFKDRMDKTFVKEVNNYIWECAVDSYYGFQYKPSDFEDSVCGWIHDVLGAMHDELVETKNKIAACKARRFALRPLLDEKYTLQQFCTANPPKQPDPIPHDLEECDEHKMARAPRCDYLPDEEGPFDVACLQHMWLSIGCNVFGSSFPDMHYAGKWQQMKWGDVRKDMKSLRNGELDNKVELGTCFGDNECDIKDSDTSFSVKCLQTQFLRTGCNRLGAIWPADDYTGWWTKQNWLTVKNDMANWKKLAKEGKRRKDACDGAFGLKYNWNDEKRVQAETHVDRLIKLASLNYDGKKSIKDGQWRDLSGNNNHATLKNGAKFNGNALDVTATNSFAYAPPTGSLFATTSFSVAVWFKPSTLTVTSGGGFLLARPAQWYLELGNSGTLRVYCYGVKNRGYHNSQGRVEAGKVSHAVYTYDGKAHRIYINGKRDRTIESGGNPDQNRPQYHIDLGAHSRSPSAYKFRGLIYAAQFYKDTPLGASDIHQLYLEGKNKYK